MLIICKFKPELLKVLVGIGLLINEMNVWFRHLGEINLNIQFVSVN